jgi:hypothetical protein
MLSAGRTWFAPVIAFVLMVLVFAAITTGTKEDTVVIAARESRDLNWMVQRAGSWAVPLALALLAVGFLTMTTVELFKEALRRDFHRSALLRWLDVVDNEGRRQVAQTTSKIREGQSESARSEENPHFDPDPAEDLARLSTSGHLDSLTCLQLEQMCGQISAAVEMALEEPSRHIGLLLHLTGRPHFTKEDLEAVETMTRAEQAGGQAPPSPNSEDLYRARNRLAHMIQRNIDHFQISTGSKWRATLRNASMVVAAAIGLIGVLTFEIANSRVPIMQSAVVVLMASVVGGYASSILRDIVAAITRVRK